jgi:hypothetical protein
MSALRYEGRRCGRAFDILFAARRVVLSHGTLTN